jgi:23S rRNA (pseudouridine1915-N3)-methyltransferase
VKVRVAWLGRPQASPYEGQVEDYRRRVDRRWPATDTPLRPVAGGRTRDPRRALRHESEQLDACREGSCRVVALDERGRRLSSEAFADFLASLEDGGVGSLLFAIGSDLGLDRDFLDRADERLSLSSMTLPHLLARLMLWEQLFRASQILGGGAYHRVSVQ